MGIFRLNELEVQGVFQEGFDQEPCYFKKLRRYD